MTRDGRRLRLFSALLLTLGACTGNCGGCLTAPSAPLPEAQRVYDGVQTVITPAGFTAGAGSIVGSLKNVVPFFSYLDIPSTTVKQGAIDATLCKFGCTVYASPGPVTLDRDGPNSILLHTNISLDGTLELDGTPTCDVDVKTTAAATITIALDVDPVTHFLGGRVTKVEVPITAANVTLTPTTCDGVDVSGLATLFAAHASDFEKSLEPDAVSAAEQIFCMSCTTFADGCPAGSTCDNNQYCRANSTTGIGECLFEPQGPVGVADMNTLAPGFYRDPTTFELHIVAGQKDSTSADPIVDPATNANFRFIGGVASPKDPPACVPQANPTSAPVKRFDLVSEAQALTSFQPKLSSGFHLGAAISEQVLTRIVQGLWSSGGLCTEFSTTLSPLIASDTLATVLPSIAVVAEPSSPAIIALRPKKAPRVEIGAGEYGLDSNGMKTLTKPLLSMVLDGLELSVYAVVEGRLTRLFVAETDARINMGMDIAPDANGKPQVLPVLGSLADVTSNIKITSSELLSEDPTAIANAVKAMVALAEPAFASQITPYHLPQLGGLQLEMLAVHGISKKATGELYDAVGVFANVTPAFPATAPVRTRATLTRVDLPPPGEHGPARVELFATADHPDAEVQYRLDGSMWSAFQPAGALAIADPQLILRGHHTLEVRARRTGLWRTLDQKPVRFDLDLGVRTASKPVARERIADPAAPVETAVAPAGEGTEKAQGCSTGAGLASPFVALAALALLRRRRA